MQTHSPQRVITGTHHVAIICSDFETSKRFYLDVLEAELVSETYRKERQSHKMNMRLTDGTEVELFTFPSAPARASYPEARGLRHLALRVSDLDVAITHLQSLGIHAEPMRVDPLTGSRFTFISDPDGLPLEFYEVPTEYQRLLPVPLPYTPGGIIFDCDGTLVDTMPLHFRGWKTVLDALGCPFSEERFHAWGGIPVRNVLQLLEEEYRLGIPIDQVCAEVGAAFTALADQATPIEVIVAEAKRFHGLLPLAVASSGMREAVERSLGAAGIRHLFDVVTVAADVARGKPAPDVFLRTAAMLGVDPSECVVYEDTDVGLLAARRANMCAVDVRPFIKVKSR